MAVNSSGNDINLNMSLSNTGGHSIYSVDTGKILRVPSITLEKVLQINDINKIDYLKIDTEGGEYDIILNTPKEILKKVDKIVMEYHDYLSPLNNHVELIEHLKSCGFEVVIKGSVLERKILKLGVLLAKQI